MKQMPPVIDAMAKGFVMVANVITASILKLATPEVIMGIYGLAGAFFMLAGALVSVASAGLIAMPALAAVTGFTAAMTALGMAGGTDEGQEKDQLDSIRMAVEHMSLRMDELVKGFGGKPATEGAYIEPIVNDNRKTKTVRVQDSRF